MDTGAHHHPTVLSPLLGRILGDLRAVGVRPSPLAILCKATDDGLTDADVSVLVDELAAGPGLDLIAASETRRS